MDHLSANESEPGQKSKRTHTHTRKGSARDSVARNSGIACYFEKLHFLEIEWSFLFEWH